MVVGRGSCREAWRVGLRLDQAGAQTTSFTRYTYDFLEAFVDHNSIRRDGYSDGPYMNSSGHLAISVDGEVGVSSLIAFRLTYPHTL